jgi:CBS-domain-containing membrane protein
LRALVWRFNKNFRQATQVAARAGLVVALTMIVYGLYFFVAVDRVIGLSSTAMGVLLVLMLGTSERRTYGIFRVRRGTIEDVMNRDVILIAPEMKVADFIQTVLTNNRDTSFAVAKDKRLHGLLMLEDLKSVPPDDWPHLEARDCMRPVDTSMFLSASTKVMQAQAILRNTLTGRAVVLDDGGLIVGQVSLTDIGKMTTSDAEPA